ncbi:MAG: hypothetical protein LBR36_07190 [Bacteroidales bacterium]|jgi:glycosyltransferase involved in cell wall biosynthesis|nr:hypothetical protein [Bacteroidales bacterium]
MKIYIAIPAMNEMDFLPHTLKCIAEQKCMYPIEVYVCVNQPNNFWEQENNRNICLNNAKTISYLKEYKQLNINIIDKSSKGEGWKDKKHGVGIARKTLTDNILQSATDDDIFISMDSDTLFEPQYCQSVADNLALHNIAVGIAVPYLHQFSDNQVINRAILNYEIYLRYYNLNLLRIQSPYAFTALGAAIVCKIKALRNINGFTTQPSGEDFYFLQKLRKHGKILLFNELKVYPSSRSSDRTPFGTGKYIENELNKLSNEHYPLFSHTDFDCILQTYAQIPTIFTQNIDNEFITFLKTIFSPHDLWSPLRKNFKTLSAFEKAFHCKADALRIFQFLRSQHQQYQQNKEEILNQFLAQFYPDKEQYFFQQHHFSFTKSSIELLQQMRDFLAQEEQKYQTENDKKLLSPVAL